MASLSHVIKENINSNLRLDRYISENLCLFSRSQIKARNLNAKVNEKDVKLSKLVKQGDTLDLFWEEEPPQNINAQDIPVEIIYEDDRCVVVNKAQGMVVHPGAGNRQGTLANAILFRMNQKIEQMDANIGVRPGIVHRLDKDTSGVIIAAYDDEAHTFLAQQFKNRKVRKTYIAIVCGTPKEKKGKIETFIARDPKDRKKFKAATEACGGKIAVTFYKVVKSWYNYSLVLLRPKTGRTHQLRVHMRYLGHPILGDPVYNSSDKYFPAATLMLHSKKLEITLPTNTQPCSFKAPVPQRFIEVIKKLDVKFNGK